MRSILILGDKRMHYVANFPPTVTGNNIYGGVDLMSSAIKTMFQVASSVSPPRVWSPYPDQNSFWNFLPDKTEHPNGSQMVRWEIKEQKFGEHKRYCLTNPKGVGEFCLPIIEDDLIRKLILGGFAPNNRDPKLGDKSFHLYVRDATRKLYDQRIFHSKVSDNAERRRTTGELRSLAELPKGADTVDDPATPTGKRALLDDEKQVIKSIQDSAEQMKTDFKKELSTSERSEIFKRSTPPDVLVFDDLGLQAGKLKFAAFERSPLDEPVEFMSDFVTTFHTERTINRLAEDRYTWDREVIEGRGKRSNQLTSDTSIDAHKRNFSDLYESRRNLTGIAFQGVMAHLFAAAKQISGTGTKYPVEPVILLSATNYIPELCPNHNVSKASNPGTEEKEKTIWQHLHGNDVLRRRTVVLFDAETIRDEISVKSGLSWERTAQDAIIEFKRSAKLRPFLRFGHVIIRFGLTGALLISNERDYSWSYSLYFNPDQDDVTWTHEADGVVLGATSVMVATIIEQLNDRCSWRNGKAVLPDLHQALDRALLASVQRLVTHFALGHTDGQEKFSKAANAQVWFDERVFKSRADVINDNTSESNADSMFPRVSAQRVNLLPFRSRHWSILAQSCHTELNNVARSIVYHGPKIALNTLEDPVADFVKLLLDRVMKKLEGDSVKSERMSSLFFDTKQRNRYFNPDEDDDKELKSEITKHFDKTLGPKQNEQIRRLVGDSFYRSLQHLSDKLTAVDAPTLIRLGNITESLYERTERFDEELKSLVKAFEFDNADKLIEHLKSLRPNGDTDTDECKYLHLLKGRAAFINEVKEEDVAMTEPDGLVLKAYGELRDAVLHDYAIPEDSQCRDETAEIIAGIDLQQLANPREYLQDELVGMVREEEPCEGWASPISTPVLRLGRTPGEKEKTDKRLTVIDRKEVESIRAVKRMIDQYLRATKNSDEKLRPERPLSFAVFGPPGSGKSIAVKKVIKMMSDTGVDTEEFTVNLSQFSKVEELEKELQNITNKSTNKVPVVFFDEFDSSLDTKYGWLRHFLAIMEDGSYKSIQIKHAVFVFAGGTCSTFDEFSLADHSRKDKQWAEFSDLKGPDFVSRLKGHINMVGINPSDADDDLYLIRRALALRFQLGMKQKLGDSDRAEIDPNILSAFLHVPEYIHGARSMRMLVDLCLNPDKKNTLSMSEVPPIHQLNMQVDGNAFAALASGQTRPVFDEKRFDF